MLDHNQEEDLYQYALMRGDLEMPIGKLSAQAGHAFTGSLMNCLKNEPNLVDRYMENGSKVVLNVRHEEDLIGVYNVCLERGVPCYLVVDSKHVLLPYFTGDPIVTAVGIGPCTKSQVKSIVKKFKCV